MFQMIQDIILGLSLLYPVYFILTAGFILVAEAVVFFLFWNDWKLAVGVSVFVNIASALLAIPFFFGGYDWVSPWVTIINDASLFILEGESYILLDLLLFFIPIFGLSVLLEGFFARKIVSSELKISFPVVLANLVTYGVIYSVLIFLGFWFGFHNTDPYVDVFDFFEGKLFYQLVKEGSSRTFFELITLLFTIAFFFGLCLILFLLISAIFQRTKSRVST